MTKPITPDQVAEQKIKDIPDEVIEIFNKLIAADYSSGSATVLQKDAEKLIRKRFPGTDIFKKGWLNIEPIYRKAGWKVTYDKPGYNESYDASFEFRRK